MPRLILTGPESFCGVGETLVGKTNKLFGLKQAKMLLGNYDSKRAKQFINMNRKKLRLITGFLTGHCFLNGYLTQIRVMDYNLCRHCRAGKEHPEHILKECVAKLQKRAMYQENFSPTIEEVPSIDPLKILNLLKEIGLEDIL